MTKTTTLLLAVAMMTTAFAMLLPTAAAQETAPSCQGPRTNDCFDRAPDLGDTRPRKFSAWNDGATTQFGEPLECGAAGATVWFTFTAVTSGVARLTSDPDYTRQPAMAVSAFSGEPAFGEMELEACGAYGAGEASDDLRIICVAGETYALQFATHGDFPATGLGVFELVGCGSTGASRISGPTGREGAGVHENVFLGNNVVDVDAGFFANTAVFGRTSSAEVTVAKSGVTGNSVAAVMLVFPGPPNPPGTIPNPTQLRAYAGQLAQWAPGAAQVAVLLA